MICIYILHIIYTPGQKYKKGWYAIKPKQLTNQKYKIPLKNEEKDIVYNF